MFYNKTLRMRGIYLNLVILRMLKDTHSLDMARICLFVAYLYTQLGITFLVLDKLCQGTERTK